MPPRRGSFGLSSTHVRGRGSFRGNFRSWRGGRGRGRGQTRDEAIVPRREDDGTNLAERFEKINQADEVDLKLGFHRISEGIAREGWLINMHPTIVKDPDWPGGKAGVDFYFIEDDGGMFKCTLVYEPYFYIACKVFLTVLFELR